jgi:hypothetical protein
MRSRGGISPSPSTPGKGRPRRHEAAGWTDDLSLAGGSRGDSRSSPVGRLDLCLPRRSPERTHPKVGEGLVLAPSRGEFTSRSPQDHPAELAHPCGGRGLTAGHVQLLMGHADLKVTDTAYLKRLATRCISQPPRLGCTSLSSSAIHRKRQPKLPFRMKAIKLATWVRIPRPVAEAAEEVAHPGIEKVEDPTAAVLDADAALKLLDGTPELGIVFGVRRHFPYLNPGTLHPLLMLDSLSSPAHRKDSSVHLRTQNQTHVETAFLE